MRNFFWVALVLALCGNVRAEETPAFQIFTTRVPNPAGEEFGLMTISRLFVEGKEFTFLPPERWKSQRDATQKGAIFTSLDSASYINFGVVVLNTNVPAVRANLVVVKPSEEEAAKLAAAKAEARRARVMQRFPGATIKEEYDCFAPGGSGRTYFVEYVNSVKQRATGELAFLSYAGVDLEVCLETSNPASAPHDEFRHFVSNFKLVPPAPPSKDVK